MKAFQSLTLKQQQAFILKISQTNNVKTNELFVDKPKYDKNEGFSSIIKKSIDLGSKSDISSESSYSDEFDDTQV